MVCHYRIEIRGCVPEHRLDIYQDEFAIDRTATTTVVTGPVQDPAHLHGMVSYLTSVGLELIEVRQTTLP